MITSYYPYNGVMEEKYTDTFQGLLDDNYYSNMLDDFNEGRLTEFLLEQEVTETEFLMTVNRLAVKWASENVLNVVAGI